MKINTNINPLSLIGKQARHLVEVRNKEIVRLNKRLDEYAFENIRLKEELKIYEIKRIKLLKESKT